jgi:hypothetical protein
MPRFFFILPLRKNENPLRQDSPQRLGERKNKPGRVWQAGARGRAARTMPSVRSNALDYLLLFHDYYPL